MGKGTSIVLIVLALVVLGGCTAGAGGAYYMFIALPNEELIDHVTPLNGQYMVDQNTLSAGMLIVEDKLRVYNLVAGDVKEFVLDAVKGRYDIPSEDGKPSGTIDQAAFVQEFKVIVENYPDTSWSMEMALDIFDSVQAMRTEFKNDQKKLIDMLRVYDAWRKERPRRFFLQLIGSPPDDLEARTVGDKVYYGAEALEKMKQLVLFREAREAFEKGEVEPLKVPER